MDDEKEPPNTLQIVSRAYGTVTPPPEQEEDDQ